MKRTPVRYESQGYRWSTAFGGLISEHNTSTLSPRISRTASFGPFGAPFGALQSEHTGARQRDRGRRRSPPDSKHTASLPRRPAQTGVLARATAQSDTQRPPTSATRLATRSQELSACRSALVRPRSSNTLLRGTNIFIL